MTQHETDTRADVRLAFLNQHSHLKETAFDAWPQLTFDDAERIMSGLAASLWRYRRPADERFTRWATAWVRRQARRHRFIAELKLSYEKLVFAAVQRGLFRSPAEDAAIEPCDHLSNLLIHLMENPRKIDRLLNPTTAKTSTMLYALARSRTRAFRKGINGQRVAVVKLLNEGRGRPRKKPAERSTNMVAA